MFLIMGFCHIVAGFILLLTYPQSSDMLIHFIGGFIELIIGVGIYLSDDCKFRV